ncbi:hypothetical protein [Shewanella khirikhana]|uniref:Double zinc ribbon n=1 Tax=Shewanella khirikhana TaxID=1965282 RepID=A0ABN5TZK6_9GAMM|nr:hypothetical protein [Shewanella khirikhana]AZQ12335.1 Double zinc ribbon [Shewanella khirikhana]
MSWICKHCHTKVEDDAFEICWQCNTPRDGEAPAPKAVLACLRCHTPLRFVGSKDFHEGSRWGVLGELGELFVSKEALDMYACQSCGKVEFFLTGYQGEDA